MYYIGLESNLSIKEYEPYYSIIEKTFNEDRINESVAKLGYKNLWISSLFTPPKYPNYPLRQCLTVYAYPKELNHWKIESAHPRWFNLEVFNRNIQYDTIDLEELVGQDFYRNDLDGKFSGKWIYVSMGSMGSVDLELMQRLTLILAKTQHKYIISKGPRHDEYELPGKNMWGARFIPQIKILPLIDLVITHGGNNTVTETFAQGKPMIIMPLFCDQLDNGQRLVETGLGVCLEPYDFDEQQLLSSIDRLLMDKKLADKLYRASERIKKSEAHRLFGEKVEQLMNE